MSRDRRDDKVAAKSAAPSVALPHWVAPMGLVVLCLLTAVAYSPSLSGSRLWDDEGHITRSDLQSFTGLCSIWTDVAATQQYYPLLHSVFWLEHKLWGDSMTGYHLINLLWHLCAMLLLYQVLLQLKIPGALLAAAIFAVHPVMVESVAWVSEQKNTLSAVFYLSAMLAYFGFDETRSRSRYFVALGFFALGLLTKTVTATLPAALLVIFWRQRGSLSWKRDVVPLLPFFVLGAAAGLLTAHIERTLIGAQGAGYELTIVDRTLVAGRVIWFYLGKLVWPTNLIFFYPRWQIDPAVWWQWLFPAAAAGVFIILWALRSKTRGPLAGWLLFVGTLAPVLGYLNVFPFIFSFVADHFQYLASLGIIVLAAAGISLGLGRMPQLFRPLGGVLCMGLVGVLAMLTYRQCRAYVDSDTLYRTTLDRNPASWVAHNNLGESLAKTDAQAGMAHFKAALQLRPDYPEALNNLGFYSMQQGRYPEAIDYLERAVKAKHDYAEAHNNLGIALYQSGNTPKATEQFRLAVEINPRNANAHSSLANVLSAEGKLDEAITHYEEAVRLRPRFVEVHYRLGEVYRQQGEFEKAIEHYRSALQYEPEFIDIYTDLAAALASANQPREAIAAAQKGIEMARTSHQETAAGKLEGWLSHYQTELQRAGETVPAQSPGKP